MDDPPTHRFTAKVVPHHGSSIGVETTYAIEAEGLSVRQGRSVKVVRWTSLRFLHLHVTSGVGTTGFPVYSARLRTLFGSREISSLDWQGEKGLDRSADYVRFMEELIPLAAARNSGLRLRKGGDPLMEGAAPLILTTLLLPLLFIPLLIFKPLGALLSGGKKPLGKLMFGVVSMALGVVLNMLPWSSGKPFEADDLPVAELPTRYRQGGELQRPDGEQVGS
ncbi:hypothetical protein [Aureimonas ureilytica]|jgi:hypothetical protein|uniref:hypothetical protein n=1 Tax=Aureimonas ureilytica TaxID=401562 RepID=UPI001FCCD567|nr:hypothetical protein [Aureimonas ureilytica]